MRARALLLFVLGVAACGGAVRPRIVTFAGELPPPVVPLAWLEGRWEGSAGSVCFAAAGPAIFGVSFAEGPPEVLVIDAPARRAELTILGGGGVTQTFAVGGHGRDFASFAGVSGRVRLERRGDRLVMTTRAGVARYTRRAVEIVPELDAADKLWAGDAAPELARLERHVVAAAVAPAVDVGFTVGLYRSTDGAQRGAYVALWQRQPTGWTLRFVASRRSTPPVSSGGAPPA